MFLVDINECTQPSDTDRCFNNGTCENTIGSYKCACANGWTGTNCAWGEAIYDFHSLSLSFCIAINGKEARLI